MVGTWAGPGLPVPADPEAAAALYVQAAELFAHARASHRHHQQVRRAIIETLQRDERAQLP